MSLLLSVLQSLQSHVVFLQSNFVSQITTGNEVHEALLDPKTLPIDYRSLKVGSVIQVKVDNSRRKILQVAYSSSSTANSFYSQLHQTPSTDGVQLSPRASSTEQAANTQTGILLNELKTGMELRGVVNGCTDYAAFVNCGVMRRGQAGRLKPIAGILHKNDLLKNVGIIPSTPSSVGGPRMQRRFEANLQKGDELQVFVKNVFVNSGCVVTFLQDIFFIYQ